MFERLSTAVVSTALETCLTNQKDKRSAALIMLNGKEKTNMYFAVALVNCFKGLCFFDVDEKVRVVDRVIDINRALIYAFEMNNEVLFSPRFVIHPMRSENNGGW